MPHDLKFRKATRADSDRLLKWRNDPDTRKGFIHTEEVKPEEHAEWLTQTLQNANRRLYIAECDQVPVGTIRFDGDAGPWRLSWTVAPESRKKGIGKVMLKKGVEMVEGCLIAVIKPDNIASIKMAEHAGFRFVDTVDGLMVWRIDR